MAIVLAVICTVGVLVLLFKPVFGNKSEFFRCLRYYFTPDIISLFRGKYWQDQWAELKLGLWLILGVAAGVAVYFGVESI